MCDGRSLASPLFRRLAGRGPFYRGFSFPWSLQFVLTLLRCLTSQDATPGSREDICTNAAARAIPCRASSLLPCGFGRVNPLTQVQQTNDIDLICSKTVPTKAVACLHVGPMSLAWPVALPLPVRIPMTNILKTLFQLSRTPVGSAMLFDHLRYSKILRVEIYVGTSLMKVFDVLLGTQGVSLRRLFLQRQRRGHKPRSLVSKCLDKYSESTRAKEHVDHTENRAVGNKQGTIVH